MSRLTWAEGDAIAEREAWRKLGAKNYKFYIYRRFAGPVAVLALLALAGYGAHWVWGTVTGIDIPSAGGFPSWAVVVFLVLAALTVAAYRVAAPTTFAAFAIRTAAVVLAWLGFIGFFIGSIS